MYLYLWLVCGLGAAICGGNHVFELATVGLVWMVRAGYCALLGFAYMCQQPLDHTQKLCPHKMGRVCAPRQPLFSPFFSTSDLRPRTMARRWAGLHQTASTLPWQPSQQVRPVLASCNLGSRFCSLQCHPLCLPPSQPIRMHSRFRGLQRVSARRDDAVHDVVRAHRGQPNWPGRWGNNGGGQGCQVSKKADDD